jgi:hypothetical protein
VAKKDLTFGVTTIRRILRELQQPVALDNLYAQAILAQALRNAASRPTPQAPMAARNLNVEGASIGPVTGGAPAAVAIGSEFGSNQYAQFQHSPAPRGLWLYPAAEATETLAQMDKALEKVLGQAIDG